MRRAIFLILSIGIIILAACGQPEKDTAPMEPALTVPDNIDGWQRDSLVEYYDYDGIFTYIDGAGEVYRSYGYKDVTVYRFNKPDAPEITLEIFDMSTPEDAYGVFSYSRESETVGVGNGYEYRGSLLCFWQNKYFVCVSATRETTEGKDALYKLARKVSAKLPPGGKKPQMLQLLPQNSLIAATIRYFHVHPLLNYFYFIASENILNLSMKTDAVLATYGDGKTYLLCIAYLSANDAEKAYQNFMLEYLGDSLAPMPFPLKNGRFLDASTHENYLIVAFDAATPEEARRLTGAVTDNLRTAKKAE